METAYVVHWMSMFKGDFTRGVDLGLSGTVNTSGCMGIFSTREKAEDYLKDYLEDFIEDARKSLTKVERDAFDEAIDISGTPYNGRVVISYTWPANDSWEWHFTIHEAPLVD